MNQVQSAFRLLYDRLIKSLANSPAQAEATIAQNETLLRQVLGDGLVANYLRSAKSAASPIGRRLLKLAEGQGGGQRPPVIESTVPDQRPLVRWPVTSEAVHWLADRRLVTPQQFAELQADAREAAFTIAKAASIEAVAAFREAIADDVARGGTLREFRRRIAEEIDDTAWSPAQLETLYRTHVGQAQAAGQRAVLTNEWVADEFPYLLWSATHDDRTRDTHLAMETWGQNGTAVYRADDPMWAVLYPPCEWNCRCVAIPLTLEDAAEHGSREAQRWLRTGVRPARPEFARTPYPIRPIPGWPNHAKISSVV